MIALLLRLYPARWRARYGDEFAALLAERPIGPFDVADVLLGALDAHLHLRGLGAASEHRKGFAMTLRIGGFAAIGGGVLWFLGMAAAAANPDNGTLWAIVLLAATVLLLVALAGLSAFQARRHPALTWAAFLVPAVGAVVSITGMIGMAVNGDRPFIGDASAWYVWMVGMLTLLVGSALFAIVSWRTGSLSRSGAVLIAGGAAMIPFGFSGLVSEPVSAVLAPVMMLAFAAGWVVFGIGAIRGDRPAIAPAGGA